MSKRTKAQNKAIRDKVISLSEEGFEPLQATAIAFRMFRDGELKEQIANVPRLSNRQNTQRKEMNRPIIQASRSYDRTTKEADNWLRQMKRIKARKQRKKK